MTARAGAFGVPIDERGLSRFAWLTLFYNLAVILWGAYVRASGSGAGCGSHWPLCNGEVIPLDAGSRTLIEFAHRLSSGFSLVLAGAVAWWGAQVFPRAHAARSAAMRVLTFTVVEALIGAFIVLLGLVAENQSMTRAASISLHYVNTLLLLAALVQTAWRSGAAARPRAELWSSRSAWRIAIAGVVLTGATGAITALGDTLFPALSLAEGMRAELSIDAPLLLALRIYHPLVAVSTALYLLWFVDARITVSPDDRSGRKLQTGLRSLVLFQLMLGFANVLLLAPTVLQLTHLLVAETVWVLLILLRERSDNRPA
ncbi:MAG TPA: COX15/CtaA family protein [Bdellovibrionota bacterium]|nr:COX15/CtaA family protein [Bdellovibrionota bacterium]